MSNYDKLVAFQKDYPELTLDNRGYEKLSKDIQERNKEAIKEISAFLTETIEGFRIFNNFKPRKDGSFDVRVQHAWDEKFTGVGYFPFTDFKKYEDEIS